MSEIVEPKTERPNTVLMIHPTAFSNGWAGATRRILQLANAFQALGLQAVLVGADYDDVSLQKRVESEFPGHVLRLKDGYIPLPRGLRKNRTIVRILELSWNFFGRRYRRWRGSAGWGATVDINSIRSLSPEVMQSTKFIWGINTPKLSGALAAKRLAESLKVPLITEIHDPPTGAGFGVEDPTIRKLYSEVLKSSAAIITTSKSYEIALHEQHPYISDRTATIHLTYDSGIQPTNITSPTSELSRKTTGTSIGYAGSLGANREELLGALLSAIDSLQRSTPNILKNFNLHIATSSDTTRLKQLISRLKLDSLVTLHGALDGSEVESMLTKCSAGLILQNKDFRLMVPGKIFELIGMNKPIFGIVPEDSDIAEIIMCSKLGNMSPAEDLSVLTSRFSEFLKILCNPLRGFKGNEEFIANFNSANLPEKLNHIFELASRNHLDDSVSLKDSPI